MSNENPSTSLEDLQQKRYRLEAKLTKTLEKMKQLGVDLK